jgi:ketosteroid isomerase-like protein
MSKKYLFLLLFCLCLFDCKNATNKEALAVVKGDTVIEEKAILKAIDDESRAFYKKDLALWGKSYVNSPKVHWVCVEPDVTLRAKGYSDLEKFVGEWMKANPDPIDYEKAQFKNENIQISIDGNTAFVSMDASNIQPDGKTRYTVGSRTMLKENGIWKILSMTSYPNDSPNGSTPNIYVHQVAK